MVIKGWQKSAQQKCFSPHKYKEFFKLKRITFLQCREESADTQTNIFLLFYIFAEMLCVTLLNF